MCHLTSVVRDPVPSIRRGRQRSSARAARLACYRAPAPSVSALSPLAWRARLRGYDRLAALVDLFSTCAQGVQSSVGVGVVVGSRPTRVQKQSRGFEPPRWVCYSTAAPDAARKQRGSHPVHRAQFTQRKRAATWRPLPPHPTLVRLRCLSGEPGCAS